MLNDMNKVKSFSLVELMIAIAIIGILSAAAVPSYRNYTIRSKVAEAFSMLDAIKYKPIEIYNITGIWPTSISQFLPNAVGLYADITGSYVSQIYYARYAAYNAIAVAAQLSASAFPAGIGGKWIWLAVKERNGIMQFTCGSQSPSYTYKVPPEYRPGSCQEDDINTWVTL